MYQGAELKIDDEFKNLIRPLFRQEYLQLEANLLSDGCRTPISIWNGVIIDGHNRYEICTRHGIPFEVEELNFLCREEAIAWICANQLGRRNLTEETRKYLIGIQYESEKIVNSKKNPFGFNQYKKPIEPRLHDDPNDNGIINFPTRYRKTALKIARENNISHGTVEKYASYAKALEAIGKKEPGLLPKILSGQYKISHNAVIELSKMDNEEIKKLSQRLERNSQPFAQYQTVRKEIKNMTSVKKPDKAHITSVKDMPKYDPDAEITGLTLTIPSWKSSITRVKEESDLNAISSNARKKLQEALIDLNWTVQDMLNTIAEE
ncbi:hypothetical protein BXO88_04075 [Oribacterium sp. C9]|uniref:hypothetical protein n=1 Tax=Oribacterium sp. C9 TaxID=1943579 RepID=UPI00098EE08F|nr:hypothetical protein [Oribacterium sp. C9]OON87456.1 hypothetical protein BXO88_04075 [Oribacterium sp. C9]